MSSAPCFTIIIAWYYATSGNCLFPEPLSSSRLLFSTGRSPDIRWPLHSILILDVKGRPYRDMFWRLLENRDFSLSFLFSLRKWAPINALKCLGLPEDSREICTPKRHTSRSRSIDHAKTKFSIFFPYFIIDFLVFFKRLFFKRGAPRRAVRPSARNVMSLDCTGFEKRRVPNKTKEFYQHERWCILPPFFFFCRPRIFSIVIVHIFDTWYCNNLYIYQIFCILTYVSVHTCAERMYVWIVGDFYVLCEIFL